MYLPIKPKPIQSSQRDSAVITWRPCLNKSIIKPIEPSHNFIGLKQRHKNHKSIAVSLSASSTFFKVFWFTWQITCFYCLYEYCLKPFCQVKNTEISVVRKQCWPSESLPNKVTVWIDKELTNTPFILFYVFFFLLGRYFW